MSLSGHKKTLQVLSARTGAPLPSLLLSFAVLHEITAIVPLVTVFYGSKSLGVGEGIVNVVLQKDLSTVRPPTWTHEMLQNWVTEGEAWATRVGRRFGIFGFEKGSQGSSKTHLASHLAGDVANAVVAYGVTKALIPIRIGLSLYLTPAFSRKIIEPIRTSVARSFRKR